ncbi:threonine/serine exporter family protein, partial [Staphylococcus sp. EG-SA-23]|uniref:threonine/serine exporter family protein n=1 Tax=Staphylococcus sp. EG-SA-23 TaxID=2767497 RepID=UPI001F11EB20
FGYIGLGVLAIAIMMGIFTGLNGFLMSSSRLLFSMGRSGIMPLVPGGLAYDATKNLVLLNFSTAINTMLEVTLIAGAIALGLL